MAPLAQEVQRLVTGSVASSSLRTYSYGRQAYSNFCLDMGWLETPASEQGLLMFVAYLSRRGCSVQTTRVYLAGIRHLHLERGASIAAFSSPRLAAALQVLQRLGPKPQPPRPAVTLQQLRQIKRKVFTSLCLPEPDRRMLWAAITLGFFGILRVSEYSSPSARTVETGRTLIRSNMVVTKEQVQITLPRSKTDQQGRGAKVMVGVTGGELCPVNAMRNYMAVSRLDSSLPVFTYSDGRFMTAQDINFWLQRFLGDRYSSHCLRIGGTTRAAEAGAQTWQLQAGGRWKSCAYQRYIRPTTESLSELSRLMTHRT